MKRKAIISMLLAIFMLSIFTTLAIASNPMPGAIWTTDRDGTEVNQNIYDRKEDVYLNGGPLEKANVKSQDARFHLPNGDYWVKVTEPNGKLLGISKETITVSEGTFSGYQLWERLQTPEGFTGYDTTTNPGGEYKVWISTDKNFPNNASKTDNFKVKPEIVKSTLKVLAFYDKNLNKKRDADECLIEGVDITATQIIKSENYLDILDEAGAITGKTTWGPQEVLPGDYEVKADLPTAPPAWKFTTDNPEYVTIAPGEDKIVEFGLVYLESNAKTIGFWSNKNGERLWKAEYLTGLNLRRANNDPITFGQRDYIPFRSWLLAANAQNMAYMLSAQLSAMKLNVENKFVSPYSPVIGYINSEGKQGTVGELILEANNALNSSVRAYQETLKNLLDDGNNNLNIVVINPPCVDGKIILP